MANELSVVQNGSGLTLYVVIRNTADGTVWNTVTSALETWADGSITSYDVALTDLGGDLYAANMPTALPAGTYRIFYYYQSGGSPAITDLLLKSPLVGWNGISTSSGGSVVLSAYALTTLESLKRRLDITDTANDDLLTEYINGVSALIERVSGIKFLARDYREWLDGNWQREMLLKHFPIQTNPRIAFGAANALSVTFAASAGIRANVGIYRNPESADAGGLRLVSVSTTGTETVSNLAFATYKSVSTLVTAINLVSNWSATVVNNQPTLDLHPSGGADALGNPVFFTYPDRSHYDMSVDYNNGRVRFDSYGSGWPYWGHTFDIPIPKGFQHVLVQYRAGYETIPADVQLLCNEIAADKYFEGTTGRGVTQINLGPYRLRLNTNQIDEIEELVKNYTDLSQMIGGG